MNEFMNESQGKECEQLQIIAISELLGIRVEIEYLDGKELQTVVASSSDGNGVTVTAALSLVECGDMTAASSAIKVFLLYRPGHYDILYKKI